MFVQIAREARVSGGVQYLKQELGIELLAPLTQRKISRIVYGFLIAIIAEREACAEGLRLTTGIAQVRLRPAAPYVRLG